MNDRIQQVRNHHEVVWEILVDMMGSLLEDHTPPKCLFVAKKKRSAATAWNYRVEYNLSYVLSVSFEDYTETVVHELCHSVADRLDGRCSGHGDLWKWIYNKVMKVKRGRHHNYDRSAAQAAFPLAKKIQLYLQLKEATS